MTTNMVLNKYIRQAKGLVSANFNMYGLGNFNLKIEDIAEILSALANDDYELLKDIYEKLERIRMGQTS